MSNQCASDVALPISISLLTHPLNFSRTLMMVGYEPLPYCVSRAVFNPSKSVYYYPNIFSYIKKLYQDVGLYDLFFTGLPVTIVSGLLQQMVSQAVGERIIEDYEKKKSNIETSRGYKSCLLSSFKYGFARTCGVIVAYPLQVIMVRQMVDKANHYGVFTSFIGSAVEILDKEGVSSLFQGLVPRCMAEMINAIAIGSFVYLLDNYVFSTIKDHSPEACLKEQTNTLASLVVCSFTHPFVVVSMTMCLSGSLLPNTEVFKSSLTCFKQLLHKNALNRGASLFFRSVPMANI